MKNAFRRLPLYVFLICLLSGCGGTATNSAHETERNNQPVANNLVDEGQATEPHFFFDFQLDSDFTEKNNESQYPYYKLNGKFNGELTGKVFIENTQIDSKITLIAMQGRDTILISEKGKEKWGNLYS